MGDSALRRIYGILDRPVLALDGVYHLHPFSNAPDITALSFPISRSIDINCFSFHHLFLVPYPSIEYLPSPRDAVNTTHIKQTAVEARKGFRNTKNPELTS